MVHVSRVRGKSVDFKIHLLIKRQTLNMVFFFLGDDYILTTRNMVMHTFFFLKGNGRVYTL